MLNEAELESRGRAVMERTRGLEWTVGIDGPWPHTMLSIDIRPTSAPERVARITWDAGRIGLEVAGGELATVDDQSEFEEALSDGVALATRAVRGPTEVHLWRLHGQVVKTMLMVDVGRPSQWSESLSTGFWRLRSLWQRERVTRDVVRLSAIE